MKKYLFVSGMALAALVLANCNPAKKASQTPVPKMNYASNVSAVIMGSCAPCHIPSKGGNKKPYDNYANVKADIDEIIRRIQLNPTDRGFMPFKKQARLADSTIAVFTKWKADGLLEK